MFAIDDAFCFFSICESLKPVFFILDADRGKIYNFDSKRGELWSDYVHFSYDYLEKICCNGNNYMVLDLYPVFENHYKINKTRFEWHYDWHWNKLANKLVFEAVKNSGFLENNNN